MEFEADELLAAGFDALMAAELTECVSTALLAAELLEAGVTALVAEELFEAELLAAFARARRAGRSTSTDASGDGWRPGAF
jgi:hypothetical protein